MLACFGGAGGQHACRVAQALGIERVMIHRLAGVLSAYGMGLADLRVLREVTVEAPLDADPTALSTRADALAADAEAALRAQGLRLAEIEVVSQALLKAAGSDTALPVPLRRLADHGRRLPRRPPPPLRIHRGPAVGCRGADG